MGTPQEALFPWNEKYQVGIAFADEQHKQLVEIVNLLYHAVENSKGKNMIGRILDGFIRSTNAHFAEEEKILASCGYPDFLAHHTEHERLAYAVIGFYQELMSKDASMTAKALDFLRDWLGQEILDADMKFAPFLKKQGMA